MLHTMWSVKGGSGVTVTSAALSTLMARRAGRAVAVDLCGDLPAAMGLSEPAGPGVFDWLAGSGDHEALGRLMVPVDDRLSVLPRGGALRGDPGEDRDRVGDLVAALDRLGCPVVVDAGVRDPLDVGDASTARRRDLLGRLAVAGRSLLVTRACYLSLRRALWFDHPPDGVVLIDDGDRVLDAGDVFLLLDLPVLATVHADSSVARAVDAGLLVRRLHRSLRDPLESVA